MNLLDNFTVEMNYSSESLPNLRLVQLTVALLKYELVDTLQLRPKVIHHSADVEAHAAIKRCRRCHYGEVTFTGKPFDKPVDVKSNDRGSANQ